MVLRPRDTMLACLLMSLLTVAFSTENSECSSQTQPAQGDGAKAMHLLQVQSELAMTSSQQQQQHPILAKIAKAKKTSLLTVASRTSQFPVTLRIFAGADPVAGSQPCEEDTYLPSPLESNWVKNANAWTGTDHCDHLAPGDVQNWIQQNEHGKFSPAIFSSVCRKGRLPQFIEPLAGILRDPRFDCPETDKYVFSLDWLVWPGPQAAVPGTKSRFFDAGGSRFGESLLTFLETYRGHGIEIDEVFVWEFRKQGVESYWSGVDAATRARWEPKVTFYDGIGVNAELHSEHNPVSRLYQSCAPDDFCAFKLDIDTPEIELPLVQQLLGAPGETQSKLDEFFFEHHVHGVMQRWWGPEVNGTFQDSYSLFERLRQLGVRAHSWV